MLRILSGSVLADNAEALVNTVNCVGVMGAGIALAFKQAYPENYKAYRAACFSGHVLPGALFVFEPGALVGPRFLVNFPTKRHWRDHSRIDDIKAGLVSLVELIHSENIQSLALPPLGCGYGGLSFDHVYPLIEEAHAQTSGVDWRVINYES